MRIWRWVLTIYIISFAIKVFAVFIAPESIADFISIVMLLADVLAIYSLYSYIGGRRFKVSLWKKSIIIGGYLLSLGFSIFYLVVFISFNFQKLNEEMPLSLIDLFFMCLPLFVIYPVVKTFTSFKFSSLIKLNYWKIYFFVFTLLLGCLFFSMLYEIVLWTPYDYFSVLTIPPSILSMYVFLYKRALLPSRFWQFFFMVCVSSIIFELLYSFEGFRQLFPRSEYLSSYANEPLPLTVWLILFLLFAPSYYALYKIAFDNNFFKKDK